MERRGFLRNVALGSVAVSWLGARRGPTVLAAGIDKPAVLGGTPLYKGGFTSWPQWRQDWEPAILKVFRSGRWFRGSSSGEVPQFEEAWAKLLGAKKALATASGTTALTIALHVLGVDAGDEVIVSPFTFIASYNAILACKALPVFADTDPATVTLDPATIESRITDRTKAIMPVHIYGIPCDMDAINPIARKHKLGVVEDACQAWLASYKGNKAGTLGDLGCFSFQESKHIPAGEGGAITSMREELIDRCQSYHSCGQAVGTFQGKGSFTRGMNYRMMHVQAALLLEQFDKLRQETALRQSNADRLSAGLRQIPGIAPMKLPGENTRPAWHLFPFGYDAQQFHGMPRNRFIQALGAEGIPCGGGYREQYNDGLLDEAIQSRGFQRLWSAARLKAYRDSFQELKGNQKTCANTVTLSQRVLLADPNVMDKIVAAVARIQKHSAAIAKA